MKIEALHIGMAIRHPQYCLIHARDARDACSPKRLLEFKTVGEFGGHGNKCEPTQSLQSITQEKQSRGQNCLPF
jgi:hypothetical protein